MLPDVDDLIKDTFYFLTHPNAAFNSLLQFTFKMFLRQITYRIRIYTEDQYNPVTICCRGFGMGPFEEVQYH